MATELGLNTTHENVVSGFLRFSREKRSQCTRSVQSSFEAACDARLANDETFTSEEVREVVSGIGGVIQADVEEELMASAHITAALLQQLLRDAEKSYLTIHADLTQLENRELLEGIADYERKIGLESFKTSFAQRAQLQPLQSGGREKLLQQEIDKMRQENQKLRERVQLLESKASSALSEKNTLQTKLANENKQSSDSGSVAAEMSKLRDQVKALQLQLESKDQSESTVKMDEVLQLRAELDRTKAELERKFVDTSQYKNMRQMLTSKNKQITELRSKLAEHESH